MTTIRTIIKVGNDGNVVVPVGTAEAGREVEVTVASPESTDTINGLPREEWFARFAKVTGSIDDPAFERPPQPLFEPRSLTE